MTKEEFRDYVEFLRSQDEISYDVYSGLIDGIDTLEQEPILDKIRAEINAIEISGQIDEHTLFARSADVVKDMVLEIIDNYRGDADEMS